MAQVDTTRCAGATVDIAAVCAVANRFDTGAQALADAARIRLGGLAFGGAAAGQAHRARGEALGAALGRLAGEMTAWAHAAADIASALRVGVERYAAADLRGAGRIG
jgi:hypothetical protein